MPPAKNLHDEILGLLTWDDGESIWTFDAGLLGGRYVPGVLFPTSRQDPLCTFHRETVRDSIRWIQANELTIREHLTAELFDWWQDACIGQERAAFHTPEEFRDRLTPKCILFWDDGRKAQVAYEQAGWILLAKVRPEGTLEPGADVFEPGAFGHSRLFREAAGQESEERPHGNNPAAERQTTAITEGRNRSPNDISDRSPASEITPFPNRNN